MQLGSRHPAIWLAAFVAACGSGSAGLGDSCGGNGDCGDGLQCLSRVCVPKCQRAPECGDGFSCDASGYCRAAVGQPGDTCASEVDCAAGLSCQLDGLVDNVLHASCVAENAGSPAGATCAADSDCRDGTCALGRCIDLCRDTRDCGTGTSCSQIPRVEAKGAMFAGCLQSRGALAWSIPVHGPAEDVPLPIPATARSVAVTFAVAGQNQMVGATTVTAPNGQVVVDPTVDYYSRPVRHQPALGQSVLAMPSSPDTPLLSGIYQMHVTSLRPPFGLGLPGTNTPTTTAVVKLDDGILLDLHFYFLDSASHPCSDAFGNTTLDAQLASTADFFQHDFLGELRTVFSNGDVALGTMTYVDVLDHPELDGLDVNDAASLLALGSDGLGVNVFFVRTLSPVGLQAFGPPGPGPAGLGGTSQSGIVIGLDTLCYRNWQQLARITGHEIARYMGLYNNVELAHDDWTDPIDHGTTGPENLMFYSEFGGTDLSPGQQQILSRSIVLRMKIARAAFVVTLAVAFAASAAMTQLPDNVVDALSTIDRTPNATDLDTVIGSGMAQPTAEQIAAIASDPNVDVGVALRSIRALSQYPQYAIAHDTLVAIINAHQSASKLDILLLRAALESLGLLRVSADVPLIAAALDHPSRDVRTTAARALRALGDPSAIPALRLRYGQEMIPQVKLAIETALAALGGA